MTEQFDSFRREVRAEFELMGGLVRNVITHQDEHKVILENHELALVEQRQLLSEHGELITQHGELLSHHGGLMNQQGKLLARQGEILAQQAEMLAQQGEVVAQQGEVVSQQAEITCRQGKLISQEIEVVDKIIDITRDNNVRHTELSETLRQVDALIQRWAAPREDLPTGENEGDPPPMASREQLEALERRVQALEQRLDDAA